MQLLMADRGLDRVAGVGIPGSGAGATTFLGSPHARAGILGFGPPPVILDPEVNLIRIGPARPAADLRLRPPRLADHAGLVAHPVGDGRERAA